MYHQLEITIVNVSLKQVHWELVLKFCLILKAASFQISELCVLVSVFLSLANQFVFLSLKSIIARCMTWSESSFIHLSHCIKQMSSTSLSFFTRIWGSWTLEVFLLLESNRFFICLLQITTNRKKLFRILLNSLYTRA